jgi:hypothetical protein
MSGRHTDPWYDSASISPANVVTGKRRRLPVQRLDPEPERWERLPMAPPVLIPLIPDVKNKFPCLLLAPHQSASTGATRPGAIPVASANSTRR